MKISIEDKESIKFIKNLNPYQIDWSNLCEYIHPKDYLLLAEAVSIPDTAHTAHFMNWSLKVFGVHIIDYGDQMQNAFDQIRRVVEES